jgi:nitrogen fixation/metabolism regulation signal transduction histidine kinase
MLKIPFKNLSWQFKALAVISIVIAVSLILTYITGSYFRNTINSNWDNISSEKNADIKDDCINLFDEYQKETSEFSSDIVNNKKILPLFLAQNTKKAYESLFETDKISDYNIEVYNSRLELFLFLGRQLNPDVIELQRALSGEKFSAVKEIGFYTYLVVFEPFKNDTAKTSGYEGVLVTARLLDIQYKIKNKFFRNFGISSEIFDKHHINVKFDFKPYSGYARVIDSSLFEPSDHFELKNINGEVIGLLYIPRPDKGSYIENVRDKFANLADIELFLLNIAVIIMVFILVKKLESPLIKGAVVTVLFIVSRYLWLVLEFPSRLLMDTNIDVFSPSHYASGVAYGIAKSIGELFITSVIILILCSYIINLIVNSYKEEIKNQNRLYGIFIILTNVIVFLLSLHIYGIIIQGLVFDSNLKYSDRSQIISTDQMELLTVQFSILLLSVSLILILLSCALVITKFSGKLLPESKFYKRYSIVFVFAFMILLSAFMELLPSTEYSLKFSLRLVVIVLTCLFALYFYRQMNVKKSYTFNTILNFSILVLVCVIFVPVVLLNKITSQENKYLELVAKSISDRADEKINILLSTSLEDIADNPNLEFEITDKNKYPKLAFNIWSETKLDQEDLNTAVFVLDTAKRPISDFNINPGELSSDSVITFAVRNIKKPRIINTVESDEDTDEGETSDQQDEEGGFSGFETVLMNREMKFYCGIKPIERIDLKNSRFNRILGYVVIAAQYDAKNFLSQSSMQIFKSFTRDNMINKLTSQPVISEFTDGDLVGSSNRDISKAFIKSLDFFRESVKDKIDKSALRYDDVEGQLYKSFYVLINQGGIRNNSNHEKIYVVSIKLNDFGLITFFVLKYLLFVVVVYMIFFVLYLGYKAVVYLISRPRKKLFRFGFREKIFASFFLVSVIPMVALAIYSRAYVNSKNNEFYKTQMISDLRLVEQYIKGTMQPKDYSNMSSPGTIGKRTDFTKIFGKGFAESHKNFNLYLKIKLESTTDEQLYKSDLLDTRISGRAFYNIALLKKDFFTETIDIGTLSVIVGYKPLYDNLNNLVGIISSQTVFKQNEINQELTESLVYIFGAYFVAVIFLIIIVNLLSYRISNPIIKLQKATEQLSRGNTEIQVKTNSKDEIGDLVNSFNKMTKELTRSRDELKKVERESAWRDIARQVAHEIKNPLTPMKLAMQHLNHAYTMGSDSFNSILEATNKMIIDQIEILNRIATEFSDFAKMPSRNYIRLNIDEIVRDTVTLMNTEGKISLTIDSGKESFVYGDKDEVKRALINIIRNSLQAIDEKMCEHPNGKIRVEGKQNNGYYSVYVRDNGIGMDDQTLQMLFEPYFSTKSTGMGLGLVITKKIIDDMKAKIYVRSRINEGTEVEMRFSLMEEK